MNYDSTKPQTYKDPAGPYGGSQPSPYGQQTAPYGHQPGPYGQQYSPQQYPYPQPQQQQMPHDAQQYPPGQQNYIPPARRRFTREEIAVLKQCNRESFFYRSLPLAAAGVGALFYLRSVNKLPAKPPFGVLVGLALGSGYLLGKISYLDECKKKLLALPNSPWAEALKREERGDDLLQEMTQLPQFNSDDYFRSQQSVDIYHDPDFMSGQSPDGLAQSHDPSAPRNVASYDELRRRNREAFWRQQAQNVNVRSAYQNGHPSANTSTGQQSMPPP